MTTDYGLLHKLMPGVNWKQGDEPNMTHSIIVAYHGREVRLPIPTDAKVRVWRECACGQEYTTSAQMDECVETEKQRDAERVNDA